MKKPAAAGAGRARGRRGVMLLCEAVNALTILPFGRFELEPHLLADGGAGHIMHMLRNLSRFTINGSICSARVFPSCVECGARTGTVWFASRQKETPLPFRFG
jgi:hypothetical protein